MHVMLHDQHAYQVHTIKILHALDYYVMTGSTVVVILLVCCLRGSEKDSLQTLLHFVRASHRVLQAQSCFVQPDCTPGETRQ